MTRRLLSLAFPFIDAGALAGVDRASEDTALQMDEETFRVFYTRTATMLWAYLSRATGNPSAADDLLQETYYRFLRSRVQFENDAHRKRYIFRIATNLVNDRFRSPRRDESPLPDEAQVQASGNLAAETVQRTDLQRAMARLKPRERDMLWLAYGQGSTHEEIAGTLGLRTGSIKPMLFRARKKLARILTGLGIGEAVARRAGASRDH
jgi:RNA polymerase sigma-70 factor, ECF subfamily